ncbi:hypothetical protein CASFOL_017290 [Castilleja foliolosa]|uniref:Band 7 domain-containing protein n=1 Tax=Castilleja foliolosa TaxID=1961234 RepID=A0ABD3DB59_9LAMI
MGNLFCCIQVDQSTVAIKERFGRFVEVLEPGCHCLPWCFGSQLAGHLTLRLQQLDVRCETKTKPPRHLQLSRHIIIIINPKFRLHHRRTPSITAALHHRRTPSITAALHPSPPHSIIIINPKFRRSCSRARAPICSGAAIKAARAPIFGGERIPAKLQQARAPICSGAVAIKEARASICSGAAAIKAARAPIFGSEQRRAAAPPARGRSQLLSLRDPVYGCVGVISLLQHQLRQLQMDLSCAKSELSKYQSLGGAISGHHHHHGLIAAAAAHHQGDDNVFVNVVASIQYRAIANKASDAFYKLSNTKGQIQAYVFDVIRASVPNMNLDDAFEQKNEIAKAVEDELEKAMSAYGYEIVQTLIVDIEPDEHVKRAMNEINAAARMRVAANEKAEAEKILQIKRAEGEAEAKYLSGLGIARQRQAIVDGLRDSVLGFSVNVPGTTAKDVMDMVLVTQYFDTMKEIGASSKSSAVFIPHGPGAVRDVASQIRDGLLQGSMV